MRRFLILLILISGIAVTAYAQQDPNDPGIQDSIILSDVHIDSGQTYAFLPIYAVTDDSVAFYNIPLHWSAPFGGANPRAGFQYYSPLNYWETYDSIMTTQSNIRSVGWNGGSRSDDYFINTHGMRVNILTIRFTINPASPSQLVTIDSAWDDRNGSVLYGLVDGLSEITPAFKRGYIAIGNVGLPNVIEPLDFSLSQNYPNPFNSSTEIRFSLPSSDHVSLVIYDIQGREVRRLLDGDFDAGNHNVVWNGIDNSNKSVSSGIYFYKLTTGDKTQTNRMTLLR